MAYKKGQVNLTSSFRANNDIEVTVPEEYGGRCHRCLNSRRGVILGMEPQMVITRSSYSSYANCSAILLIYVLLLKDGVFFLNFLIMKKSQLKLPKLYRESKEEIEAAS
jgi:hypothetical protein